jgi:hypothetical protein
MKFLKSFLLALIGSIVANLILLFVLKPFVINPAMPLHSLSVGPVAALTAIGTIGATIVYAILRAFMARPNKAFIWLSVIVLLISLIPDYLIIGSTTGPFAGATLPSALTLMLMHVAAALIIVWSLVKVWGARNVIAAQTLPKQ